MFYMYQVAAFAEQCMCVRCAGEYQSTPFYRFSGGDSFGNPVFRRLLFALQDAHLRVFGFSRQDLPNLRYTQDINEGIRTIPPSILAFYVCKVRKSSSEVAQSTCVNCIFMMYMDEMSINLTHACLHTRAV